MVNRVYEPCPTTLYSATQSHCSVLSCDMFLYGFTSLDNANREPRLLGCYCSCKTLQLYFSEKVRLCVHYSNVRQLANLILL